MRLSALACFSISLVAVAATAGESAPDPGRVAAMELEAGLARSGDVYLVLEPWHKELQIKARGVVLDSIALRGVEALTQRSAMAGGEPARIQLPAIWQIVEGPAQDFREIIAPEELKPYDSADDGEEDAGGDAAKASPTPTPVPQPPVSYTVALGNGWNLLITEKLPGSTLVSRVVGAVKDGWKRLFKPSAPGPPVLALAMSADDARRLHHLLRATPELLITAPPA